MILNLGLIDENTRVKRKNTADPMQNHRAYHILVVDDEPSMIKLIQQTLVCESYRLFSADSAEKALTVMETNTIDVVISDQVMTGMSGIALFEHIQPVYPDIIRILLTGRAEHEDLIDAINRTDIFRIILKPFHPKELRAIVEKAVFQIKTGRDAENFKRALGTITRMAPDGIFLIDDQEKIVFLNESAEWILGSGRPEAMGMDIKDILAERVDQSPGDTGQGRFERLSGLYSLHRNNNPVYIELLVAPVLMNEKWHGIGIARDITRRISLESSLQKSRMSFKNMIECQKDPVIVTDRRWHILYVNPAAEIIWGKDKQALFKTKFSYPILTEEPLEVRIKTGDGTSFTGEMKSYEIEWEDNTAYLACIRDVTHRKKLELNLEKAISSLYKANTTMLAHKKQLIEEERLKMLLQLAGAAAEDLDEPVKIIQNSLSSIKVAKEIPIEIKTDLQEIEKQALLLDLLLGRLQNPEPEENGSEFETLVPVRTQPDIHVLVVDDEPADFFLIQTYLEEDPHFVLSPAATLKDAKTAVRENSFDFILLDYNLPDGTALDFLRYLKQQGLDMPVAVVTGIGDEIKAKEMIQNGAYDYLPKANINREALVKTVSSSIEQHQLQQEMKTAQNKILKMSYRDELTGLYNRRYFMERLAIEMDGANRYKNDLSLCLFDIDHFKQINDTYGHLCGDDVLKAFGNILLNNQRKTDLPARYGGEEIAIILHGIPIEKAVDYANRIRNDMAGTDFSYGKDHFKVTVSAGVASYASPGLSCSDLIKQADLALYEAKKNGRNCVLAYG